MIEKIFSDNILKSTRTIFPKQEERNSSGWHIQIAKSSGYNAKTNCELYMPLFVQYSNNCSFADLCVLKLSSAFVSFKRDEFVVVLFLFDFYSSVSLFPQVKVVHL